MWQPEVTGALPARGTWWQRPFFFAASGIHMKRTAPESDAASGHQCAVRYTNKPTHSYLSKKICKHVGFFFFSGDRDIFRQSVKISQRPHAEHKLHWNTEVIHQAETLLRELEWNDDVWWPITVINCFHIQLQCGKRWCNSLLSVTFIDSVTRLSIKYLSFIFSKWSRESKGRHLLPLLSLENWM